MGLSWSYSADALSGPGPLTGPQQEHQRPPHPPLSRTLVRQDELDEYKRLMDVEFRKNALRPGDPGYKHDVQVHAKGQCTTK